MQIRPKWLQHTESYSLIAITVNSSVFDDSMWAVISHALDHYIPQVIALKLKQQTPLLTCFSQYN